MMSNFLRAFFLILFVNFLRFINHQTLHKQLAIEDAFSFLLSYKQGCHQSGLKNKDNQKTRKHT